MCLNLDAISPTELISEIDGLIAELIELKSEVPQGFQQWQKLVRSKL